MINIFFKRYWRKIFIATLFFGIYAIADLSLVLTIGMFATGQLFDQNVFNTSNIDTFNLSFLIIIFIFIRFLILKYTSLIGYKKIFDIYIDLGAKSINEITSNNEFNSRYLQPGFLHKYLSKDIDFIVAGFLIPLTALFIELIIFTVIASIIFTKLGLVNSILLGLVSFFTFSLIIKRNSKKNKALGRDREKAEEEKTKFISLIQSSLFDIYSYSSNQYAADLFNKSNEYTRKVGQAQSHNLIIGRASFETLFCFMICIALLLSSSQFQEIGGNNNDTFNLILAFSIRLIPGIGRIISSTQTMAYSWPCFKEFFSQKITSKDIKFKKRNLIFKNKNQILLEINNDTLYRKNTKIIDIDKFIIKSGSWTTICGESGSGKSTLLESIFYFSNKINLESFNVAFMPQSTSLISNNIYESIALSKKYDQETIDDILVNLGLKSLLTRSCKDGYLDFDGDKVMSGGQLQRLILARTLYHKKNFLILDEFTSSLDEDHELRILDILKKKQIQHGVTILCSSHRNTILKYSDKVYKISNKRIENIS